jgi:hypothetical protein
MHIQCGNTVKLTRASSWFCFPLLPIVKIRIVSQWLYILFVIYIKGIDTGTLYMHLHGIYCGHNLTKNYVQNISRECFIPKTYKRQLSVFQHTPVSNFFTATYIQFWPPMVWTLQTIPFICKIKLESAYHRDKSVIPIYMHNGINITGS